MEKLRRWWPFIWDRRCRRPRAAYPGASDGSPSSTPLFGLAPDGVYLAAAVTDDTGELLPHLFTLTRLRCILNATSARLALRGLPRRSLAVVRRTTAGEDGRSALCGTFPGVTPGPRYGPSYPVVLGLSSHLRRSFGGRPPGPLRKYIVTEKTEDANPPSSVF